VLLRPACNLFDGMQGRGAPARGGAAAAGKISSLSVGFLGF
jgi:hypothetical protein